MNSFRPAVQYQDLTVDRTSEEIGPAFVRHKSSFYMFRGRRVDQFPGFPGPVPGPSLIGGFPGG